MSDLDWPVPPKSYRVQFVTKEELWEEFEHLRRAMKQNERRAAKPRKKSQEQQERLRSQQADLQAKFSWTYDENIVLFNQPILVHIRWEENRDLNSSSRPSWPLRGREHVYAMG